MENIRRNSQVHQQIKNTITLHLFDIIKNRLRHLQRVSYLSLVNQGALNAFKLNAASSVLKFYHKK
jgi:hypothetical protein